MAELTLIHCLLDKLRRLKFVYPVLRILFRLFKNSSTQSLAFLGSGFIRIGAPRFVFSGLKDIKHDADSVILEKQSLKQADTNSLRVICDMNQNGRQPWPIFYCHFKDVHLVGSSLAMITTDKKLLLESAYGMEFYRKDPAMNYLFLPPSVCISGNVTNLISVYCQGYYHWMMDALPRLKLLEYFPKDTLILVPKDLRPYQNESLRMLGLEDRIRPTKEYHLKIKNYFFSSPTAMTGCDNPYAIDYLRKILLPHAKNLYNGPKRFYIRRKGQTRGIINENEVIALFLDLGWAVVELEDLGLAEQIALFSKAEAFCGLHGAAFTNVLWISPGCKVLELCAHNFLNGCYEGIMAYLDEVRHGYLIFEGDSSFRIRVDLETLSRKLKLLN
jgi:hypothetical protein